MKVFHFFCYKKFSFSERFAVKLGKGSNAADSKFYGKIICVSDVANSCEIVWRQNSTKYIGTQTISILCSKMAFLPLNSFKMKSLPFYFGTDIFYLLKLLKLDDFNMKCINIHMRFWFLVIILVEVAIDEFVHFIHTIKCSIVKEETNILVLCR